MESEIEERNQPEPIGKNLEPPDPPVPERDESNGGSQGGGQDEGDSKDE